MCFWTTSSLLNTRFRKRVFNAEKRNKYSWQPRRFQYFFKEIILFVLLYLQLLPDSSQCLQNHDHVIAMCKCSKFFVVKQPWSSTIVAHGTNTTDCSSEIWVAINLSKSCCGLESLTNFWWCSYSHYEFGKTDPRYFLKPLESLQKFEKPLVSLKITGDAEMEQKQIQIPCMIK